MALRGVTGGRWRAEEKVKFACQPCVVVGMKAAVRDARPATGCDAIWRA